MIHERWGLTPWVRDSAERLAARGYVVLAVDVYRGRVADDPNVALAMMRGLDPASAVADLRRGVAFLLGQPGIDADRKVGAIGWDMGGGLARLLAQASDLIGPVAICSGAVTTDRDQVDRLVGKPVLGIFGALDPANPPDVVRQFGAMLADRATRFNLKIYPNVGHSFMRPGNPDYSPDDARAAWVAIEEFFSAYLHGEP
jgi:carboxymethylenebutenolidase